MEIIRNIVKSNKEPSHKEVFWLDIRDKILKYFNNGGWEPIVSNSESVVADNEDITSIIGDNNTNIIKFADKEYLPSKFNGLGRVYLRKNVVEGKNILTQDMVRYSNTIYIVQYDYDLNNLEITIPEGSILEFQGGTISNGTINFNNTKISSTYGVSIFNNISVKGSIDENYVYDFWFVCNDYNDSTLYIQDIIQKSKLLNKPLFIDKRYNISSIDLLGVDIVGKYTNFRSTLYTFTCNSIDNYSITINNGSLTNVGILVKSGNGIDASVSDRKTVLDKVYIASASVRKGSIGISIGTDELIKQSIVSEYKSVTVRNFDTCFLFNEYCNSNVYTDLYALNTTDDISEYAYMVKCHGSLFNCIRAESSFTYSMYVTDNSYNNIFIMPWFEGSGESVVRGGHNYVLSPMSTIKFGTINARSKIIGGKGTENPYEGFTNQSNNMIEDSSFCYTDSTKFVAYGANYHFNNTVRGYNSITFTKKPNNSIFQLLYTIKDKSIINNLLGKRIFCAAIGKVYDSKTNISIRIRYAKESDSSNVQLATGVPFTTEDSEKFITATIPTTDVKSVEFYLYGNISHVSDEEDFLSITLPMLCQGSIQDSFTQRYLTDNGNTIYGCNTYKGGTKDSAHPIIGDLPIYIDENKYLYAGDDMVSMVKSGSFLEKPINPKIGFAYFCTDKKTIEGDSNGIIIYYKGDDIWVDSLGRTIE